MVEEKSLSSLSSGYFCLPPLLGHVLTPSGGVAVVVVSESESVVTSYTLLINIVCVAESQRGWRNCCNRDRTFQQVVV